MIRVESCKDATAAVAAGQVAIRDYLHECKINGNKVLLCLSGGSALALLTEFPYEVLGDHVTVTVLDERYSTNPTVNNMAQIATTGFLDNAVRAGCHLIDTRVKEGDSLEEVVVGYNLALSRWINKNPTGKIVATVGMGPDGHTAGIIPGSAEFESLFGRQQVSYVVGYEAAQQPEIQKTRVTTTFAFLGLVSFAVMLILGENKRQAMDKLLAREGELAETPARIWKTEGINVVLVTDLIVKE